MPSMHHALIALAILIILPLGGCVDGELGSFTFTEESDEVVIQGRGGGLVQMLPLNNLFPPMALPINLEAQLEAQDAGPAKAVYLRELTLQITDTAQPEGDTDDFAFVREVRVFVESTRSGTSLTRRQIAEVVDPASDLTRLDFVVDQNVDLKPYIEEGVRLTTEGRGDAPPDDVSLIAVTTFRVNLL